MSDLPTRLRTRLAEAGLSAPLSVARVHDSQDGTRKLLLQMRDERQVESVLMPRGAVAAGDGVEAEQAAGEALPALSLCISSQVGCAMGCVFCASGVAGLKRQMSAAEITAQVLLARRMIAGQARLAGVVLMGMGEPLHNSDAVARSLRLLSHPQGAGISLRRITVSTSGLVDGIDRLGRDFDGKVSLAVSVHAPDDAVRSSLMPINRRYPLSELIAALHRYPLPSHRRITIEYTLIAGKNDAPEHARALAARLSGLRAKINLIPMNAVVDSELAAPGDTAVDRFQRVLQDAGFDVFVRRRRGDDIAAACGQLALPGAVRKIRRIGA
jgi:23S rRNA (adenine2503-C2)-methyltransferase